MSRMAIPVLPWLAVGLLTFLTYRQRELLQAGLAGAALLLGLVGFGYWLYLSRRSMQRSSAHTHPRDSGCARAGVHAPRRQRRPFP